MRPWCWVFVLWCWALVLGTLPAFWSSENMFSLYLAGAGGRLGAPVSGEGDGEDEGHGEDDEGEGDGDEGDCRGKSCACILSNDQYTHSTYTV